MFFDVFFQAGQCGNFRHPLHRMARVWTSQEESNFNSWLTRVSPERCIGYKWKFLLVYMDDICVFSSTFDEHIAELKLVFDRLRESRLKLKPSKCHFCQTKIKFLGHVVTNEGILPDPNKVKAVNNIPLPTNVKNLVRYLW